MILPAALSGRFLFLVHWCLCVLRTLLLVTISLSHVPLLAGVLFGPVLLLWMGVVFGPLLDIWNLFLCLLCWYSNNQNHWSKS